MASSLREIAENREISRARACDAIFQLFSLATHCTLLYSRYFLAGTMVPCNRRCNDNPGGWGRVRPAPKRSHLSCFLRPRCRAPSRFPRCSRSIQPVYPLSRPTDCCFCRFPDTCPRSSLFLLSCTAAETKKLKNRSVLRQGESKKRKKSYIATSIVRYIAYVTLHYIAN